MDEQVEAFKSVIRRGEYLVLDTETTGLERGEICQICIVDAAGKVQLNTLVKPVNRIPLEASKIHDIYDSDVTNSPDWATVSKMVQAILADRDVVIYNATYDRNMMHQSAEAAGLAKVEWKELARFWDAMEPFAAVFGEWNQYRQNFKWQKLSTAASYYKLPVVDAHSALGDCLMTLGVIKAMAAESTDGDEGIPW